MQIYTVVAFAILFWHAEEASPWVLTPPGDRAWTLAAVLLQPALSALAGWWIACRTVHLMNGSLDAAPRAQFFYHRGLFALRVAALLGFLVVMFLTPWPRWFSWERTWPSLQIVGDLLALSPFFASVIAGWLAVYPVERRMRAWGPTYPVGPSAVPARSWPLWAYLDFNVRHHLLVVTVPMTLILFAANLLRARERDLYRWTGAFWAADVLLGLAALVVFLISPALLRHIWRTIPLQNGELRTRLEELCRRIGLRVRDILVWHSDGLMINAAVMGVVAPLRYVMLSDALLGTMDVRQIEAVFGHEAGHVRRHHIPLFLIFAFVGWLLVAALMELLARIALNGGSEPSLSAFAVQGAGVGATVLLWAVGFGWLSRRFEREADLFGARCATPDASECRNPCSVHLDPPPSVSGGRLCSTGTAVFTSALDRVAVLNGIPHEERSWRHSSIGSRIRFLTSLAGDPNSVARFERVLRWSKRVLVILAVTGSAATLGYLVAVPRPAILRLQMAGPR